MQWWFKSCPKCQGDLFDDYSWGDWAVKCLQCGHNLNMAEETRLAIQRKRDGSPLGGVRRTAVKAA